MLASRRSLKFLRTRSQLYHQTNMFITDMLLITEPAYKELLTGYLPSVRSESPSLHCGAGPPKFFVSVSVLLSFSYVLRAGIPVRGSFTWLPYNAYT